MSTVNILSPSFRENVTAEPHRNVNTPPAAGTRQGILASCGLSARGKSDQTRGTCRPESGPELCLNRYYRKFRSGEADLLELEKNGFLGATS